MLLAADPLCEDMIVYVEEKDGMRGEDERERDGPVGFGGRSRVGQRIAVASCALTDARSAQPAFSSFSHADLLHRLTSASSSPVTNSPSFLSFFHSFNADFISRTSILNTLVVVVDMPQNHTSLVVS